ncbi:hypothetical protein O3P69_008852 [Scylla paramamosain]|uniref:Ionotropic glutamate receptor L-glutamate and glycine-binding domain-containing protein n=1 Tax=Scylla paramamosain TaxID=85552 RepID=A0AAW0TSU0_SCYPA
MKRFVVAGLTKAHLETFTTSSKGRKSEHIVGIVKNNHGNFEVFTNLLYKNDRLVRVFTWGQRTQSGSITASTSDNRNLAMVQGVFTSSDNFNLFSDKTKDLEGATLNVVTFLFPPVVMYRRAANGSVVDRYGGNIRLAQAVAGMYNFSIRFIEPPPGELWGELTSNGTWNGMVGLFAREEGDIGVANLFITALGGRRKFQEYTFPYGQESTCFLIRRGAGLPRWQSLALPFAQDTWLAVLLVALLVGPVLYVLSQPQVTSGEKLAGRSFAFSTLYTFAVHLRNSRPLLPLRTSLQVFVAFLWVYVIIVTEAYSANLTAFLTVERVPEGINTLKELYQSSFTVYAQGPFFGNNLAAAKNEHARIVSKPYNYS